MPQDPASSRILTLVFTDLVESTALKVTRGDAAAGDLIARHRSHLVRIAAERAGRIIDFAGDGCFLSFEAPSAAVQFALELQHAHALEPALPRVRVGIHLGEVTERAGAGAPRLEGLAVDLAARVQSLARPGQILLSAAVASSARQRLGVEQWGRALRWLAHGPYHLKGAREPLDIVEVGLVGVAPFEAPETAGKARSRTKPSVRRRALIAAFSILATAGGAGLFWLAARDGGESPAVRITDARASFAPIRSLAVLPLANLSNDAEQQFFVDGMHDELIARLSKLGGIKVIARMSTLHYRDTPKPAAEVGRELGVEGLIEGSVRRAGSRVAITVQLVRAATGESMWAESYQRDVSDVLLLQSEMAQAIAGAIGAALTPAQRSSLARARKINPAAYDAYLRGRQAWWSSTSASVWQAKEWYEKSIALDPGFALAYANLGYTYLALGQADQMRRHDAYTEAERVQEKAVELENTPEIRLLLAGTRANTRNAWSELSPVMDEALAIDPNNSTVYMWRSQIESFSGRHDEAIADWRKSMEVDPFCRPTCEVMLSQMYRFARRDEEAMRMAQSIIKQYPNEPFAWLQVALLHLERGAMAQAMMAADRMARFAPTEPWVKQFRAYICAKAGRAAEARRLLGEFEAAWSAGRPTSPVMIGLVHLTLGAREQFFPWLERGFDDYDPNLYQLQDPIFDPVRDDPRFQWAMKRRAGEVQGPYQGTR